MMRRATALALAAALLGGLLAVPAGPAGAQNGDSLLDAPRLGFEIDPKAGHVGDTVATQVDPDDVAEHCISTEEELIVLFEGSFQSPSAIVGEIFSRGPIAGIDVPDTWPSHPIFGPVTPPAGWSDMNWTWNLARNQFPQLRNGLEGLAAMLLATFFDNMANNLAGPRLRPAYLAGTAITTFVDPVSQELVGETAPFDMASGLGTLPVPSLQPGLWVIAAACVEPVISDESFAAAVTAGAEWLADEGVPFEASWLDYGGEGWLWENAVPVMLAELMQPRALGLDFYCILNEEGFCATPPDPVGLLAELTDEELAEFADLEAGAADAGAGADVDAELLTEAVTASPSFTG